MSEIQEKILDIYNSVRELCDRNGIIYFAIGGTCIGAIRHKGFIPWDDDIDIAIPIEDYERFISLCKDELPKNLSYCSGLEQLHNFTLFYKIMDTETTFIEDAIKEYPDVYRGVFIDVMPLAGLPANKIKRKLFIIKLRILATFNSYRRHEFSKTKEKWWKKAFLIILRPIIFSFPFNFFYIRYYKELKKHPTKTSESVGYTWSPNRLYKLTFSMKAFSDIVEMPFEDTTMKCPIGYEEFLSTMFGNYMQLPPENKRVSGHTGYVDLNKPFSYYKEYYKK